MVYETEIRVRYAETDAMGVVYHSNYLIWFEVARTEMMRRLGRPYSQLEEAGHFLPVIEANCRYIKSARYDETLKVTIEYQNEPGVRIRFLYRVNRCSDNALLAEGFTVHLIVNREGAILRNATATVREFLSRPDPVLS